MDLKRLRTFVTVADQGTVSLAAATLRITQPALSRQLQDLQAEFGVALFNQVGRRLRLTAEGAALLPECRSLLGHADTLVERGRSLTRGDRGVLRVGATPHVIANFFPGFLHKFAARFPDVRLQTMEGGGLEHGEAIRRGDLHAAISTLEGNESEFTTFPLPAPKLMVAYRTGPGVKLGPRVEVHHLAELPLLVLTPNFGVPERPSTPRAAWRGSCQKCLSRVQRPRPCSRWRARAMALRSCRRRLRSTRGNCGWRHWCSVAVNCRCQSACSGTISIGNRVMRTSSTRSWPSTCSR